MAADTFTWIPSSNSSVDTEPRLSKAQFGDGYEQVVPKGINFIKDTWQVTFANVSLSDGNAIVAFLKAHAGGQWFWFTDPISGGAIKVRCTAKFSKRSTGPGSVTVNAEFAQCFDPGN